MRSAQVLYSEHWHEEFPGKTLDCCFYGHSLNASTENLVIGHGNLIICGKHKSCVLKIYIYIYTFKLSYLPKSFSGSLKSK